MTKKLKLTLAKSINRRTDRHKACVRGLGLTEKIDSTVEVDANNPCIQGMIEKVRYLLKVEEL